MKKILIILGLALSAACYSQTAEIENNESGASARAKINETIVKGNNLTDSIGDIRTDINNNVDSLDLLRTDMNTSKATTTDHAEDISANTSAVATNATNISSNSISISTNASGISDNTDTTEVLRTDVNIAIGAGVTQAGQLSNHGDSLAVHLDTLQAIRPDVNNKVNEPATSADTLVSTDKLYFIRDGITYYILAEDINLVRDTGEVIIIPAIDFIYGEVLDATPSKLSLFFTKDIVNFNEDSTYKAFTVYANDSTLVVDSADNNGGIIELHLDYTVPYGKGITVSYDPDYYSGIQDENGNSLAILTKKTTTNSVEYEEQVLDSIARTTIYYKFDGNNTDAAGIYDFENSTVVTHTSIYKSGAAIYNNGLYEFEIPDNFVLNDTFTLAFYVYPTAITENNQEIFETSGGNLKLYIDWGGSDINLIVNGTEAQANNIKGGAGWNLNDWHHIVVTYANGVTKFYIDNVDETDVGTAGTGGSLAGPIAMTKYCRGIFDEMQIYNGYAATSTDVRHMYEELGFEIKTTGYIDDDEIIIPDDFDAVAATLYGPFTFEDIAVGAIDVGTFESYLGSKGATSLVRRSNNYSSLVPGTKHPKISEYTWDSLGTPITSRCITFTQPEDFGSTYKPLFDENGDEISGSIDPTYFNYYNPTNTDITFARDTRNLDCYLTFTLIDENTAGHRGLDKTDVHKTHALYAGMNWTTKPDYVNTNAEFVWWKVVSKGTSVQTHKRYVTDPMGIWTDYFYIKTIEDPENQPADYSFDLTQEGFREITLRIVLTDINDPVNGFYEVFINGKFSHRIDTYLGLPIKLTNGNIYIDGCSWSANWGGGWDEVPEGSDMYLHVDNYRVFRYHEDTPGAYWRTKSPSNRILTLPKENSRYLYQQ